MNKRMIWSVSAAVVAAVGITTGTAIATPSSGIVEAPVVARGGFPDRTDAIFMSKVDNGRHVTLVRDAAEMVVQRIVLAPGGNTGWHTHPGPAVAVVQQGELTLYQGKDRTCTGTTYAAGQAFVDPGQGNVHIAQNRGDTNAEVWVTYFDVPPGGSPRIDAADPGHCEPDLGLGGASNHH
jgi:quercetin dioxygenase-like cupin family protein